MEQDQRNKKISAIEVGEVGAGRLEALTDGIFAIAMTILVLNVKLPDLAGSVSAGELFSSLAQLWPTLASFIVSFIILGMFWVAHHTEFRYIKNWTTNLFGKIYFICCWWRSCHFRPRFWGNIRIIKLRQLFTRCSL
jgi:uncharacterized membrane protein